MPDFAHSKPEPVRSVQDYIDEGPIWPDGTRLPSVPMTQMQRLIWMLAAAGKFFEGFVVFMTGVALPLIARQFGISPTQKGMVAAASLAGILVGALGLGSLSDTFGRKSMFVVEMIIFTAFLAAAVFSALFRYPLFTDEYGERSGKRGAVHGENVAQFALRDADGEPADRPSVRQGEHPAEGEAERAHKPGLPVDPARVGGD